MFKYFAMMFSEGDGSPSSTRLMTAFIVFCIVGLWAWVSIENRRLEKLEPEHVGLVVGALGVKAWQRGRETTDPATPDPGK